MRTKQIIGLDITRFAAALLVVLYHMGALYLVDPDKPYLSTFFDVATVQSITTRWMQYGWIGVQIFFVISGIVITASIDGKTAGAYIRSRFLRLYPGVWVCTAISMVCIMTTHQADAPQWLPLWLRSSVIFPLAPWVDGAYWTLPVELLFYALMLVCIGRTPKTSLWVAGGLALGSMAFWTLHQWLPHDAGLGKTIAKMAGKFRFDIAFIQYGIYFAIGIFIKRLRSMGLVVALVALLSPICFLQIAKIADRSDEVIGMTTTPWIPFSIWLFAVAFMLVSMRFNDSIYARLSWPMINRIRQLGLATYPLYLTHVTIGFATVYVASQAGLPTWLSWVLGLAVPIATSFALANQLEPKVRAQTDAMLSRIKSLLLWQRA